MYTSPLLARPRSRRIHDALKPLRCLGAPDALRLLGAIAAIRTLAAVSTLGAVRKRGAFGGVAIGLLLTGAAPMARAHIVPTVGEGTAGRYFETALRVSHGCDGSPTTSVTVRIPPEIVVVKPQYKPGWTIEIRYRKLDAPFAGENGRRIDKAPSQITWRGGPIPDNSYDSFGLLMKLPDAPGRTLAFATLQTCARGSRDWAGLPGAEGHADSPAPLIRIRAAEGPGGSPGMKDMPGMHEGMPGMSGASGHTH